MPKSEGGDPRPFEVIGIPLTPGFHVLEIASQKLGDALLDERYGSGRTMYVRTTALATNLAVHFKLGRENSLAWVTTLDKGKVVAERRGARVGLRRQGSGHGHAPTRNGLVQLSGLSPERAELRQRRATTAPTPTSSAPAPRTREGVEDLAFTWSDWQRGIEPWRFNVPTSLDAEPDRIAHTVFDRTLLRAGETVSMKHLHPHPDQQGLRPARGRCPDTLVVTHVGSGQQFTQPIAWRKTATGGRSAENTFAIPPAAKLGVYQVELRSGKERRRRGGAATAPASSASRSSACRCSKAVSRPADKKPLVAVDVACRSTCRSTTWPAAARPTCRCACRPWCAASSLSLRRLRRLQLLAAAQRSDAAASDADEDDAVRGRRARGRRQAAAHARPQRRRQAHDRQDPGRQGHAARTAARSHLRRPQRRGADAAQHPDAVARRRRRRHQDRRLGLDQPEAQASRRWRSTSRASRRTA